MAPAYASPKRAAKAAAQGFAPAGATENRKKWEQGRIVGPAGGPNLSIKVGQIRLTNDGVTKACRYDPDLNPTYQEMAMHYGVGVVPARPYKPRDKAKVESGVQLAERWIIAALRNRKFFSIEELNQAIRELRDRINLRPFRKREGTRATQFAAVDKLALSPLPAERFDLSEWSRARVNIDYHIAFDTNYYSVPYNLVQELVEVRSTPTTIEIFHKSQRVASHLRAHGHGHAVTIPQHRPRSHQAHLEWTPSRMVHWAQTIGPNTARLFERIWPTSRTRRWAIEVAWESSGWRNATRRNAWKPLPSAL